MGLSLNLKSFNIEKMFLLFSYNHMLGTETDLPLHVIEFVKTIIGLEISLIHFFPEIFLASSILALTIHASLLSTARSLGHFLLTKSYLRLCLLVIGLTLVLV